VFTSPGEAINSFLLSTISSSQKGANISDNCSSKFIKIDVFDADYQKYYNK
jgi:hypothetical protein